MTSPFGLFFYSVYGPTLNVLQRWPSMLFLYVALARCKEHGEDMEHDILDGERSTHRETEAVTQSMEIEQRVRRVLDGLGAPYEVIPIEAAYADTMAFCERYGFPLDHSVNTIIVSSKKEPRQHCACLVLATTRLDVNHTVRKLMGVSRASFASAEDTMALTGMMIGGVTVFALPRQLPIYIDEISMALDYRSLISGGAELMALAEIPRCCSPKFPG